MSQNTKELLEKLANKLGTSSEYLWEILMKQAPIQGFSILSMCLLVIVTGIVFFKIHKNFVNKNMYEKYEETLAVIMASLLVVWIACAITCFVFIPEMVYAFANPEYWALQKILDVTD